MNSSFDLGEVDDFATGALGEPGSRVFFLQAVRDNLVVTLRLEKQQVSTLADYLQGVLTRMGVMMDTPHEAMPELREPIVAEWVVATLGIGHDESSDHLVIVAEELIPESVEKEAATARFLLGPEQALAFVEGARRVVAAGRPPCPICGHSMNPEGHVCPRSNGHGSD
ncbi:MAG: hypothetical protein JJLCMIEE_01910 [Acidimicrobiales bacterium]|nr:MAG: DUF3090 family protein [Actinomycetota bacterium]MBV6508844.1 hypothetical protein [Acidimicrobiales bacterium]RIK04971.1 MAG: DUF3090 domain-containing protein [Acidobacteriota bacterium]